MSRRSIPLFIILLFLLIVSQGCASAPEAVEPTDLPPAPTNTLIPPTITPIPPTPTQVREAITAGNIERLSATWGFDIPDDIVRTVAFSPDGLTFAAGTGLNNESPDQKLRLFDLATGQLLAESEKMNSIIWDLVYSPEGDFIAVGLDSGIVQIRGPQDLRQIQQYYFPGPVNSLSISPDGSRLAAGVADDGNGMVFILDLESGEVLLDFWAHPYSVADMDFSPDGSLLATGAIDRAAKVWDSSSGELVRSLPQDGQGTAVAFSRNGGLLASGYCARSENSVCQVGGVLLWSTTTWDLFRDIEGPGNWVEGLAFSAADDLVVGADRYEYLNFWQVDNGVLLESLRINSYGSYAVAISKDGYSLLVGSAYSMTLLEISQ